MEETTPTGSIGNDHRPRFTLTRTIARRGSTKTVGLRTPYDITPDGRFVGRITAGQAEYVRSPADQIQVVLNWTEELKRLVPTK